MKKIKRNFSLFIFCAALANISLVAQPVLTYSSFAPQSGDKYIAGHTGSYYAGSTGTNLTWNFSTASVATIDTFTYGPASAVACAAQFPSAALACRSGGSYAMTDVTSSSYLYYGTTLTPAMPDFIYSDPEKFFQYPMNYTNTFTDYSQAVGNGGNIYRRGYDTVTYCGYGTIITPNGTYPNTICIHRRYTYADSSQSGYNVSSYDFYYWFAAGYRYPVAQSWNDALLGLGHGTLFLQSISAIGTDEILFADKYIQNFPNPFSSVFTLKISDAKVGDVVTFTDLSGRIVQTILLNGEQTKVDLSELENGMYVVTVNCGKGKIISKKIIKN